MKTQPFTDHSTPWWSPFALLGIAAFLTGMMVIVVISDLFGRLTARWRKEGGK